MLLYHDYYNVPLLLFIKCLLAMLLYIACIQSNIKGYIELIRDIADFH